MASLRSNEALDILSLSRFPAADARWISHHLDVARRLRLAFPTKPVLLTAFGMPTHEFAPPEAAVAESGIWLGAFERGLAGAGKWTMRDLPADSSSSERSYGLISSTGEFKPSAYALPALARYLRSTTRPQGNLEFISGPAGSFDYRFTADDALFSSGRDVIDEGGLRWEGRGTAQLFADWSCQGEVVLLATAPGQVTIDMSRLLGVVERPGLTVATDGVPLPHERRGNSLSLWVAPGQQVVCRLGLQSVDAKIATVRPKRGSSLEDADAAIFTANLTYPGTRMAVPGGFSPTVILWCARGESPARAVARGVRRLADSGERRIPVWEFDDVDLRLPPDKVERLTFSLSVTGIPYRTNVWVLDARAAGALTAGPDVISPEGELPAEAIEAQISAVHLHEQLARSGAKRVDIRATLSASNVGRAALADLLRGSASETGVWLVSARDGAVGERTVRGTLVSNIKGGAEFVFRGVELEAVAGSTGQRPSSVASGLHPFSVASGLQPARVEPEAVTAATGELHFWIEVDGIPTRSSFWTYTT